jgi:hypothetical protein
VTAAVNSSVTTIMKTAAVAIASGTGYEPQLKESNHDGMAARNLTK